MKRMTVLAIAAVMIAGAAGIATAEQCLFSTIAFSSTRDNLDLDPINGAEIYLMNPDQTNQDPRRLTDNTDGDAFPHLSPDGKHIVFDSNRARGAGEPVNTSDVWLMNAKGEEQTLLTRGSSATWSPDGKHIAFHRSASGDVCPISNFPNPPNPIPGCPMAGTPGAETWDSDIFVMRVPDDGGSIEEPINITNTPELIDNDPDWSPDGQTIVYVRHPVTDNLITRNNSPNAEIYVLRVDGSEPPTRLTDNLEEERGPAWSPDGTRIAYMCRKGVPATPTGPPTFEICVMNADGTGQIRLTNNGIVDATPAWSPDGQKIVFHRGIQLWLMNADGTGQEPLTAPPGANVLASWGVLRAKCPEDN